MLLQQEQWYFQHLCQRVSFIKNITFHKTIGLWFWESIFQLFLRFIRFFISIVTLRVKIINLKKKMEYYIKLFLIYAGVAILYMYAKEKVIVHIFGKV